MDTNDKIRNNLSMQYSKLNPGPSDQNPMVQIFYDWIKEQQFTKVILYKPANNEPDLTAVISMLPDIQFAIPSTTSDGSIQLFKVSADTNYSLNQYGWFEPTPTERMDTLIPDTSTLVFFPSLAADLHGNRTGYGYGVYNKMFMKAAIHSMTAVYDQFLMSQVPTPTSDCSMKYILTESLVFTCCPESSPVPLSAA